MRIRYALTDLPRSTEGYNVTAFTEGHLWVEHTGTIFLDTAGILLVEFAVVLHKWLVRTHAGERVDLAYSSMDFEESPMLRLKHTPIPGMLAMESVWAENTVPDVKLVDMIMSAEDYIPRLGSELSCRLAVDLNEILRNALDDDPIFVS